MPASNGWVAAPFRHSYALASVLLAKTLLCLMSAKTADQMDGVQNKIEGDTAYEIDRRPTRWVVLRGKVKTAVITLGEASVLLAKTLLPLMSAAGRRDETIALFHRSE